MSLSIGEHTSLLPFNTLAIDQHAEFFCRVDNSDRLGEALDLARQRRWSVTVLGGGSNIVLVDDVPGLVIQVDNRGVEIIEEDEHSVRIRVAAGENWHRLVQTCIRKGWHGLENLSLIPGNAGAAPIQNIGAYGVELSSVLSAVVCIRRDSLETLCISATDCELGYRDSVFKHALADAVVISAIELRLLKSFCPQLEYAVLKDTFREGPEPDAQAVSDAVCAIRRSKLPDPVELPNVGSFFKNPVIDATEFARLQAEFPGVVSFPAGDEHRKLAAAWLIDQCGWKGQRKGPVGVHTEQALVLVNPDGGFGTDILELARDIAVSVDKQYGVALEVEPRLLPAGASL